MTTCIASIILGNEKCDPTMSKWVGYNEGCCTVSDRCGVKQGGCSSDDQCGGGNLICGDSATGCGSGFETRQKCCHIRGNTNYMQ